MASRQYSVPGSERSPLEGSRSTGTADPRERIEVTVVLRRGPAADAGAARKAMGAGSTRKRASFTREQLEEAQGAAPEDIVRVESFAQEHGLDVVEAGRAGAALCSREPSGLSARRSA